jgi:hypothetical protein
MVRAAMDTTNKSSTSADLKPSAGPWRIWVLAALDLVLGVFMAVLGQKLPSAGSLFEVVTAAMGLALAAAALGLLARRPWGWWLSIAGSTVVLLIAFALILAVGVSLGFLWGSFGALGRGATAVGVVAIAVTVELFVLVPAFQLWWLLSPGGRRAAGRKA